MTMISNASAILDTLKEMKEIESASIWNKVHGKERIYIEVIRTDRDGKRYGGSGGKCYLDLITGEVMSSNSGYNKSFYINSFTKSFHEDNKTTEKIADAAKEYR